MDKAVKKSQVVYGQHKIPFSVTYSATNRLSISVRPDFEVWVRAPLETEIDEIIRRVHRRGGWILKQWRHFQMFHPLPRPKKYVSGETHNYLGRRYRLKIKRSSEESVKLLRGFLLVEFTGRQSSSKTRKLLEEWYDAAAKRVINERIRYCQNLLNGLASKSAEFHIRPMTTRWGSCSRKGRITLNPLLVQAPKECIDYIILHELCHLIHRNHNFKFWQLLEKYVPDWKRKKARLELSSQI